MLKKILAAATGTVIAFSGLSLSVGAVPDYHGVKLPFELLSPRSVSLAWLGGDNDSPTSMQAAYSMSDDMCKWMSEAADPNSHEATLEKLKKDYNLTDITISAQIDWAIDDPVNGWHHTEYWDGETFTNDEGKEEWAGFGHDKDQQSRVGEWDYIDVGIYAKTVNDCWIFRGLTLYDVNDLPEGMTAEEAREESSWFYGTELAPGIYDQIPSDVYTLIEVNPETKEKAISIDWTEHTAYIRVRWAVIPWIDDFYNFAIFSDWSVPAGFGKDVEPYVPFTEETIEPPVISDLRYYEDEFNGYPQVACTLTVPDKTFENMTKAVAAGGDIHVEFEARIPDGEWIGMQADSTVTAGENIISLQNLAEWIINQNKENGVSTPEVVLAKDSPVELRARYYCSQYNYYGGEYLGEFYTGYSEVLTFGTQEMSHTEESAPSEASVKEESKTEVSKTESKAEVSKQETSTAAKEQSEPKCKLCKNCPAPLGLCIWIWIAIIVAVIIIVVIIIVVVMKSKKKKGQTPPAPPSPKPDDKMNIAPDSAPTNNNDQEIHFK